MCFSQFVTLFNCYLLMGLCNWYHTAIRELLADCFYFGLRFISIIFWILFLFCTIFLNFSISLSVFLPFTSRYVQGKILGSCLKRDKPNSWERFEQPHTHIFYYFILLIILYVQRVENIDIYLYTYIYLL